MSTSIIKYPLLAALLLCLGLHGARADCPTGATGFANGVCQAQSFAAADAALSEITQQFSATLPPAGQTAFQHEQQLWLAQRGRGCSRGSFIDFGCAAKLTRRGSPHCKPA